MSEPTVMRNARIPVLTGRVVALGAAGSLVIGLLPVESPWGLLTVNGALLFAYLLDWLLTLKPSRVGISRSFSEPVGLGEQKEFAWELTNPRKRRLHVAFNDELLPSLRAQRRGVRLVLSGGRASRIVTTICPERRGRFEIGAMTVRTWGPLGLAGRQGTREMIDVLRVVPPFASRRDAEMRLAQQKILDVGTRMTRTRGAGTDIDQLREFTIGDDPRHLDWFATARANKPIVRTYRVERNQQVLVLLDCGRQMAARVGEYPRLDHAIDATLALTTVATGLGDRVGFAAFDAMNRGEVAARSGNSQLGRITEALYALHPRLVESDYRGAIARLLPRMHRRTLLVIMTDLAEGVVAEALRPSLATVVRRHKVIVATAADGDVGAWARSLPDDAEGAYRKASATLAISERRDSVVLLRQAGVTVVDAPASELPGRLADAYLDLKASLLL